MIRIRNRAMTRTHDAGRKLSLFKALFLLHKNIIRKNLRFS